jgi:uncharacterized protein (DUF2235 family)
VPRSGCAPASSGVSRAVHDTIGDDRGEAQLGKNLLIFSDGTGQRGGLLFDERRSNIYKLYRATRCGPDSSIDPSEQVTFYDPGLGTLPGGLGVVGAIWRGLYNLVSQATGLGITANIIDCYAAIIRLWQPGDRIFLFGFSRGAYTVRCLAGVMALCGVPTRMKDGSPLKRDVKTSRAIAAEAVKKVYQHVSSPKDAKHVTQRLALAERFRADYGADVDGKSNSFPYFIGVFDTVASLANPGAIVLLAAGVLLLLSAASGILWYFDYSFLRSFGWLSFIAAALAGSAYLVTHVKCAVGLKDASFWDTLHVASPKFKFYDQTLNSNVGYARHALSIDEERADFPRVPWGTPQYSRDTQPNWFEQIWFAGNHSDIGGSYPENESRLSDIALRWMVDEALSLPAKISVDASVLQLYPSAAGMQHDECKSGMFRYGRKVRRTVAADAPLHPSVYERLSLSSVLQCDVMGPYRPEGLREHGKCKQYYAVGSIAESPAYSDASVHRCEPEDARGLGQEAT